MFEPGKSDVKCGKEGNHMFFIGNVVYFVWPFSEEIGIVSSTALTSFQQL